MLLLCLDASLARTGAALWREDGTILEAEAPGGEAQAAAIAVLAERVLARAGVAASSLSAVAATVGPGGFTGIRAGLALAHGIAAGAGVPVIAVATGEALAIQATGDGRVAVLIDSRRGHRFLQLFDRASGLPRASGPAVAVAAEAIACAVPAGTLTVGDAPEAAIPALPRARDLGAVAAARLAGVLPPLAAQPLYLDPPAARPASGLRPAPA
jgi:tRNA threonylcarbamoyl adenosine modification protein YeaZ